MFVCVYMFSTTSRSVSVDLILHIKTADYRTTLRSSVIKKRALKQKTRNTVSSKLTILRFIFCYTYKNWTSRYHMAQPAGFLCLILCFRPRQTRIHHGILKSGWSNFS